MNQLPFQNVFLSAQMAAPQSELVLYAVRNNIIQVTAGLTTPSAEGVPAAESQPDNVSLGAFDPLWAG